MKLSAPTGNLGLKILALTLAIVLYYALKPNSFRPAAKNDNRLFTYR